MRKSVTIATLAAFFMLAGTSVQAQEKASKIKSVQKSEAKRTDASKAQRAPANQSKKVISVRRPVQKATMNRRQAAQPAPVQRREN